jgi:hypothetical protein
MPNKKKMNVQLDPIRKQALIAKNGYERLTRKQTLIAQKEAEQ